MIWLSITSEKIISFLCCVSSLLQYNFQLKYTTLQKKVILQFWTEARGWTLLFCKSQGSKPMLLNEMEPLYTRFRFHTCYAYSFGTSTFTWHPYWPPCDSDLDPLTLPALWCFTETFFTSYSCLFCIKVLLLGEENIACPHYSLNWKHIERHSFLKIMTFERKF